MRFNQSMSHPKGGTFFFLLSRWRLVFMGSLLVLTANGQQSNERKLRFAAGIEGKTSFIRTHYALFLDVKAGLELKIPLQMGVSYCWMQSSFDSPFYDPSLHGSRPIPEIRMRYAGVYVDYNFFNDGIWEFILPAQIGFGESFYQPTNGQKFANAFIVALEFGIDINLYPLKYIGLGVGLGYRIMLLDNPLFESRSDAPYYQTRIKIRFVELIKAMRSKR